MGGKVKRSRRQKQRRRQEGGAFRVHPLFLLAGAYACFNRSLPLYLGAVLVALEHECAHSLAAAKLGFCLNRVVLMPYGAVITGNLDGISFKDEIRVAAAGPLCNLCTALFFAALWWLFPDTYAYTDTAFYLSLFIGAGNLLPFYPLDGFRIVEAASKRRGGFYRFLRKYGYYILIGLIAESYLCEMLVRLTGQSIFIVLDVLGYIMDFATGIFAKPVTALWGLILR